MPTTPPCSTAESRGTAYELSSARRSSSRSVTRNGASRAWKLVTPNVSHTRAPTTARSTLPARTSATVRRSQSTVSMRGVVSGRISSDPLDRSATAAANSVALQPGSCTAILSTRGLPFEVRSPALSRVAPSQAVAATPRIAVTASATAPLPTTISRRGPAS